MKKIILYIFILVANSLFLMAQDNFYRSKENTFYWGNRKPNAAYWQQDVHYKIKADINEKTDILSGEMQLTYWNNSPDTLYEVFFHLYENAFQPCSYYHDLHVNNKQNPKYGKYELQCLGTEVPVFKHEGKEMKMELDNTIFKVKLEKPILPNTSTNFDVSFKTYYDSGDVRRRNKIFKTFGNKHFDGTHWYPIMCVYDSKFGWTTDQHLGREFYANFGTFEVELTFASNFIVEATGVLQNKEEVLPDSLRKKLDISNFKDKPVGSKPSVIIPYDSTARKTWKYHAENVHNFAFTADPTYRIGETYWEDVQCIALVQEQNAANWMPVADYTAKVVELFSKDFGRYAYPKMIVADARDGMEYPMLTLCGGLYPGNKGLIAHEVGHNWFYGMIGSNETYRAMMDEGFTQFITVWALENIPPDSSEIVTDKKWNTVAQLPARDTRGYLGYLIDAVRYEDMPLNTHSDMFNGAIRQGGGYRHVYSKTATMLYNLQYVLGDTLFQNAMKHYFNQWKMAHPYPEDFRNSITQYTKVDLNWFFDQWMETTKTIDYKVSRVRHKTKDFRQETNGSGQKGINAEKSNIANRTSQIVFKRKGEMQMPIDFSVVLKNNDTLHYHISNTWFDKTQTLPLSKGELEGVTVLPRWIGWQKLQPTYTATIQTSEKIKDVIIDPSNRLADIDMTDNSKRSHTQWHWDKRIRQPLDWRKYHVYTRPELWWNAIDGFRVGWHLNGNYMQYKHKVSISVWFPTTLAQGNPARYNYGFNEYNTVTDVVNYRIDYETGLNKIVKGLSVFYTSGYVEGLEFYRTGFTQKIRNSIISAYIKLMTRPKVNADFYVVNGLWLTERINNSVNVEWNHKYNYDLGTGKLNMTLRSNSIASDYDFSFVEATKINYTKLWKLELRTRFFARYGFGNNIPYESALSYTGANNEELMDYALLRSKGFVPPASVQNQAMFSFQQGGGLNLRGYAGMQTLSFQNNGVGYALASGGAAINAEIDLDGLIKLQPKNFKNWLHIDFYLFADAGIGRNQGVNALAAAPELPFVPNFEETLLADAGAGIVFNIKRWGKNSTIKPFSIRFDMPFWVSNGVMIRQNNFANRWVFGLYRSF